MTKIAYLDCPTGIAGDMCLGALVDAGVPLNYLQTQLAKLGIKQEYCLETEQIHHNALVATKFHVQLLRQHVSSHSHGHDHSHGQDHPHGHGHDHPHDAHDYRSEHLHRHGHDDAHEHPRAHSHEHLDESGHAHPAIAPAKLPSAHDHGPGRHLSEIQALIGQAQLPQPVEDWSLKIFERLAQAEAAVHGCDIEAVHFHEVGATDAIVDIVGTCLGLHWLGIEQVYCSPLPTGGGTVWAAHGRLPVPAPAVLKLFELGRVPVYSNGIERELVTPTGAAIATIFAGDRFGPPPAMRLHRVGHGAGTIALKLPNMLRLWIGEVDSDSASVTRAEATPPREQLPQSEPAPADSDSAIQLETVMLLETQLDDLSPQAIGYVFGLLLEAGALDVFTQAIAMKKNRPGTLLTVICHPDQADALEGILFRETTTLGVRRQTQQRRILARATQSVETPYGSVRIKVAWAEDPTTPTNVHPEYEDCARLAQQHNQPWQQIHRLALEAWHQA